MNARLWVAAPALVIAGALAVILHEPAAIAAAAPAPAQGSSTLDDQTELALTVYNSNIALVRDVRTLQLPRGAFDLQFMDIAATVNPPAASPTPQRMSKPIHKPHGKRSERLVTPARPRVKRK